MVKKRFFILLVFSLCLCFGQSGNAGTYHNRYPIIFVQGLGGWGPDEMLGHYYWGGKFDLKKFLEEQGFTIYISDISAFSSNWDRAIELFYQIKGGQVDYGFNHSNTFGHIQRPTDMVYHNPLYPQWNAHHPVHFVGHSMGGQTIRMLAAMMSGRDPKFQNIFKTPDGNTYTPGDGWIKSITTLSTPHNGTAITNIIRNTSDILSIMVGMLGISPDQSIPLDKLDNYDLKQWDIKRHEDETLREYFDRIIETIGETKDICTWDISVEGARQMNTMVNSSTMDMDMYCFSFANEQTIPVTLPENKYYFPSLKMNPLLIEFAFMLGILPLDDPFKIGQGWRENDGLVNTVSMIFPVLGCKDSFSLYHGLPKKRIWNYMGKLNYDHGDIVGQTQNFYKEEERIKKFYLDLVTLLWSLE